jgi:Antitoxin VbhA
MPLTLKITEQERAKRLDEVRQALASVRLEGLEPGHEAHSIYQRYVEGELTLEQMGAEIEALHDREYGPVPIPRNGRP